ncbi:hypothetical protein [Sporomusa sp. KB1]|jgi:hypothetical protein|uniref:hypothetical protein n=1 Tax=Sporomusa sp. KB1 TaxID=943346 RepID=UPI0011A8C4EC|nr:hypothetical protein [Sporomusa sp. KB1]TWH46926.1 hypothetical protein Salpa_2949 [Sporomusa sp. KB1]
MSKRAPTLLSGDCPHLKKRHSIIAIYCENYIPNQAAPHYQIEEIDCDYSDECGLEKCPIAENAPKHPPGIGPA